MKFKSLLSAILFSLACVSVSQAQTDNPPVMSTPPLSPAEREALYNRSVENRTQKILEVLKLTDPAKSNEVHDAIVAHYHALRARDEAIDAELSNLQKGSTAWTEARVEMFPGMSKPLHERFVARLSQDLTPGQIEKVKDKLTYGKVEFTYDAYCQIVPGLTDEEKAKILALLKEARDEAMDGGSADEKTAVFQHFKNQINSYLNARGHDVAKAIGEWNIKQEVAKKETAESASLTNSFLQ